VLKGLKVKPGVVSKTEQAQMAKVSTEGELLMSKVVRGIVHVPISGERVIVGTDRDGKPATRQRYHAAVVGELVKLPPDDTKRLRALGVIKDPNDPSTPAPASIQRPTRDRIELLPVALVSTEKSGPAYR
jgi:hypothetical protein